MLSHESTADKHPSRQVNYAKLHWAWRAHHDRFKKFVLSRAKKLICQDCGGAGGEKEVILDDGTGPWIECEWCEGTGYVTPHLRSEWLKWRKVDRLSARAKSANGIKRKQ